MSSENVADMEPEKVTNGAGELVPGRLSPELSVYSFVRSVG